MSFRSVAAKNVAARMARVMTLAGTALVSGSLANESLIRAQSPLSAAPPNLRLPDESAGVDAIARTLVSAFDQADIVALGEAHSIEDTPGLLGIGMHRMRLFCAIGVSLWSAVVAGNQAAPAVIMPEALLAHVKDERFGIVTSIRGLPLGVRNELQTLWGSQTLDIADPGAEFQLTDVNVNRTLPTRRLVAAGCAPDHHCLVYYERGGGGHTWLVALFHWTPAATRFEWGGAAPGGLETIDDVRDAVLSGAIKNANGLW